jgi:hypothetical protein
MLKFTTRLEEARAVALDVLRACSRDIGFYASGLPGGYEALWARDSMTTSLGASLEGEEFRAMIKKSLLTLADNQAKMGQIPNCVGSWNEDRQSDVTFNSVDAPLWFILGHFFYAEAYKDVSFAREHKTSMARALWWLRAQDPDNLGLIAQQPTNDWFDAFPHKYGYVLHNIALYYAVLKKVGEDELAETVKKTINGEIRAYSSLFDKKLGFYFPWGWKNHDSIREHEEWFDTAANLLAILSGLATPKIAESILAHIDKEKINRPFPCKCLWPPIKKGDKEWHDYFELCDARDALSYSNAGIWPFIGGFYVAALVKTGKHEKAEKELELLAEANLKIIKSPGHPEYMLELSEARHIPKDELVKLRQKGFNEWLHGKTGEPRGEPYQAWSAGAYLYAYHCVKQKKAIYFE